MSQRFVRAGVIGLLTIQALLLTYSAKVHSPTWDEVGHLAAGISHWKLGRFELYSVNPPLVRTIASAPVVAFCDPKIDWAQYRSDPSLRSEVYVGRRMIELNGQDSMWLFFVARLALVPIVLAGGWLCFLWARDLFGPLAGLIAIWLWTFSPNVIAYGSVITPDLSSAVALLASGYLFWRWMKDPSWVWSLSLAGVLALAMLTKSVWVVLPFLFVCMWGLQLLFAGRQAPSTEVEAGYSRRSQCVQLIVATGIAFVLMNAFYGFQGTMRPLGQYRFVSTQFSGNEPVSQTDPNCTDCVPKINAPPGNRFAGTPLGGIPIPVPANFVQGIDIQTRDFERGRYDANWQSYLLGKWKQGGWWYYYILGLFWKVPLATWLIVGAGTVLAVFWRPPRATLVGVACLWVPTLLFFVIVSASTGLNRYVRYALPVLPVLFVWGSQLGRLYDTASFPRVRKSLLGFAAVMCAWVAIGSSWYFPHHLSYFNEIAGGPDNGHRLLCDSNLDWGQDLTYLQDWLQEHPEASESLNLAYFGSFDPVFVGIDYRMPPSANAKSRFTWPGNRYSPGWYVVSKNYLVGHTMPIPDGTGRLQFRFAGRSPFKYLESIAPVDQIGGSLLVYRITDDQVDGLGGMVVRAVSAGSDDSSLSNR